MAYSGMGLPGIFCPDVRQPSKRCIFFKSNIFWYFRKALSSLPDFTEVIILAKLW